MRKIKFRGKTIEDVGMRRAGEWAYGGYFVDYCYGGCPEGKHYIVEFNSTGMGYFAHTRVEKDSVGQFIGLHDKNGKEIYEGDIIKEWETDSIGVVEYDDKYVHFFLNLGLNGTFLFGDLEVIGNIYENPELIETEESE